MSTRLFSKLLRSFSSFHSELIPTSSGKYKIGYCRSVEVTCISEIGWRDIRKTVANIKKFGNMNTSQYLIEWDKENAAGSSSLVALESSSGKIHRFLIDAGWEKEYMAECFRREKVDELLSSNQIDFLYLTHEHMDHFFGIESVLRWNKSIPIVVPYSFSAEGVKVLNGENPKINKIPHEGKVYRSQKKTAHLLYDGCATFCFDMKTILGVEGEQTLYFNVKDKGLVGMTGCCHEGVVDFLDFGKNSVECDKLHAIYGGLHIAPEENLTPQGEEMIKKLGNYSLEVIACNHCTGQVAAKKMKELGYPLVKGSGKHGSSETFIGSGDKIKF